MAANMMLLTEFLPLKALSLGTLVDSLQNPIEDAFKPMRPPYRDDILLTSTTSFEARLASSTSASFNTALTQLFTSTRSIFHGQAAQLQSTQVKRYQLKEPRSYFKSLCLEEVDARMWLERGIQTGKKSYLVVELQTALNPSVHREETRCHTVGGEVVAPVSTIATGGIDVFGLGGVLDTGVGGEYAVQKHAQKRFDMDDEHVFAVGYKKIVWKSWGLRQKKDVKEASLDEQIRWTILGQKRASEEQEEEVSVDLSDDLLAADAVDGGLEGADDGDEEEAHVDADVLRSLVERSVEVYGQRFMFASSDGDMAV